MIMAAAPSAPPRLRPSSAPPRLPFVYVLV